MAKTLSAAEVAQHNTKESCWVVLYGHVYDVTSFLSSHPGGAKIILSLAGTDATEEYDPVHPAGVLETDLPPEAKLGRFNNGSSDTTLASAGQREPDVDSKPARGGQMEPKPLEALLNIDDLEEQATRLLSEKAHAYYYSAADDLLSKTLNNTVFRDILLRPRVFVDCTTCDLSTSILGHRLGLPVYVSPAAMARLGHSDGELGIAQAASRFGAMQIVSNSASMTPEQIVADTTPGQIFGWQLYVQSDRSKSEAMLQRINKLREWYKFVCLTVDAPIAGKRELDERSNMAKGLLRVQSGSNEKSADEQRPGGGGVGQQLFFGTATDLTWETTLTWLSRHTDLPIVLKGIQTHEDALLAAQSPHVKAIILSNHGGRSVDTAPPAVHTLLEIRKYCPEVFSRVEVWIDGGIRRGTDVVKALCLGAKVVGVGRAPLWGLGAGGRAGVERMFEILEQEISTCMRLLGVKNMTELGPRFINARKVEQYIYDGNASLDKERAKSRAKL